MENSLRQLKTLIDADVRRIRSSILPPPDPNAWLKRPLNRHERRKVRSLLKSQYGMKARKLRRN